jgi:hypothetical protein
MREEDIIVGIYKLGTWVRVIGRRMPNMRLYDIIFFNYQWTDLLTFHRKPSNCFRETLNLDGRQKGALWAGKLKGRWFPFHVTEQAKERKAAETTDYIPFCSSRVACSPTRLFNYFPIFHITLDFFEHRMKFDGFDLFPTTVQLRISIFQFIQKVCEFVFRLSCRNGYFSPEPVFGNLPSVESVSSAFRLVSYKSQVIGNGAHRISRFSEPYQLGVVRIPFGGTLQNFLSQKTFPPERDQPPRIQKSRMYRPDSHGISRNPT